MYWSTHIFSVIAVVTNSEATKRCLLLELRHDCNYCRFLHACVVLSQQCMTFTKTCPGHKEEY